MRVNVALELVPVTKAERLAEFLRRLQRAEPAANAAEAFALLASTLNAVEDELAGAPYAPTSWQTDGRMYPPQPDSSREVVGRPDVTRYRSRAHNTFICANGAIEIRTIDDVILVSKPGADGHSVWEH
jgi:hypothetical protein